MDYKARMRDEYKELKDKYDKLHKMLVKYDAGKLEFTPTCPIDLLREQASVMGRYLYILETRALIEDVDLAADERQSLPQYINDCGTSDHCTGVTVNG